MPLHKASLDFETRSTTDLRKAGVHRYVEDENTSVLCFSWKLYDVQRQWRAGDPDPVELLEHIREGGVVKAHNAGFERAVWNRVLLRDPQRAHWPELRIEQQDCTMARAAASGLPQDLDTLCAALGTAQRKDKEGHNLMMKMCRPRRVNEDGTITWWDSPREIDRLMQYCDQDVRAEEGADERIPELTDYEKDVWRLDQIINERGIPIDVDSVRRCTELTTHAKKEADREMRQLTRSVPKCSNDAKIIAFINSRGIECTTVKKGEKDSLLFAANLAGDKLVERVINLRSASKKTSTAKYETMLDCICDDARIRGLLNYHGAAPGRWAGRLVQPQNFPRFDYEEEGYIIEWFHELLADKALTVKDVYELLATVHGVDAPLRILSQALRSMIKAPEGKKLVGGDFANIEGRLNAWFANETWKLQAFRDFDAGHGDDLYKLAYAKSFGISIKDVDGGRKSGRQRQIGKVEELSLGYQGSVAAVLKMGPNYGLDPYKLTDAIIKVCSSQQWDATAAQYESATNKEGLQQREWTAIKILVDNWRNANANIVQSWWDYQDAAIAAVAEPGSVHLCGGGRVQYYSDGSALWCVLPSGRMICYMYPEIKYTKTEYTDKFGNTRERTKRGVSFWGYKDGQWQRLYMYGGLQCENIVQGTARCVMVDRMFAVEREGYPIILTVHDELLTEPIDHPDYSDRQFERIMCEVPPFVTGMPLAAKAWEDKRYIK